MELQYKKITAETAVKLLQNCTFRFAKVIGLKRCWFHHSKTFPHYDLYKGKKNNLIAFGSAMKKGAIKVSSKEIVNIISQHELCHTT